MRNTCAASGTLDPAGATAGTADGAGPFAGPFAGLDASPDLELLAVAGFGAGRGVVGALADGGRAVFAGRGVDGTLGDGVGRAGTTGLPEGAASERDGGLPAPEVTWDEAGGGDAGGLLVGAGLVFASGLPDSVGRGGAGGRAVRAGRAGLAALPSAPDLPRLPPERALLPGRGAGFAGGEPFEAWAPFAGSGPSAGVDGLPSWSPGEPSAAGVSGAS